mgnify:CR=1
AGRPSAKFDKPFCAKAVSVDIESNKVSINMGIAFNIFIS